MIVEGVTAARAAIRDRLACSVFVTAPEDVCLARVLDRDGAAMAEPMRRWRAVEAEFFAADRTAEEASLVVDGTYDSADSYAVR